MIVVLDASAAIEIALQKESAQSFENSLLSADLVLAPDTYPSEITNVFWKYAHFSGMDRSACERGIDYCLDLIDDYIDTKSICREVFFESLNREHSSYDLFYLIVARRHAGTLITRDKKMISIAQQLGILVLGTR
jgi:predicted nucleic acid-binding protein